MSKIIYKIVPEIPEEFTAIPNDWFGKYSGLFKGKKQSQAILDLISQAYAIGVAFGRHAENKDKAGRLAKISKEMLKPGYVKRK